MLKVSHKMLNQLSAEVTTLAICWELALRNGKSVGFTNHDYDLLIGNIRYFAKSGFTASAILSDSSMAVDNLDIEGIIDHHLITESDILSGAYDYAEIKVFMVNYNNIDSGILKLRRGWLGEVKLSKERFIVEIRGLIQAFSGKLGEVYSPNCRAIFGDKSCKISLTDNTINNLKVKKVIHRGEFYFDYNIDKSQLELKEFLSTSLSKDEMLNIDYYDDYKGESLEVTNKNSIENLSLSKKRFDYGLAIFYSGDNQGISMEIKSCNSDDNNIKLALPLPYNIKIGDTFKMIAGCDKNFNTCSKVYNNALNFRGEPHIPQNITFHKVK